MAVVTGTINVNTSFNQNSANIPGGTVPVINNSQSLAVSFGNGIIADLIDTKYSRTLVLGVSTPVILDLTALTDVFGNAVNFARVRSITIVNKSTTANLLVGNAGSNPWTGIATPGTAIITVPFSTTSNRGLLVITAPGTTGLVVSAGNKSIQLDPGANTFSVDIEIVGASA